MNSQFNDDLEDRLLTLSEVVCLLRISKPSLYRLRANKAINFPKPVNLNIRRVYFSARAVQRWIDERKGEATLPDELKASSDLMAIIRESRGK